MFVKVLSASVAAAMAIGMFAVEAQADHRKKRRAIAYDHYYAGPKVVRSVPGLRLFFGDYALTEEEFNQLYGTQDNFDESYYDPEPVAPPKPRQKKVVKASPAPSGTTASIDTSKKPEAKPVAAATASALPCDKATAIVSDYGFTGVKAETCKGKVYAFNATRDGKPFAIKVDSASGELTEVKKLE